jgi:hypothetical protein
MRAKRKVHSQILEPPNLLDEYGRLPESDNPGSMTHFLGLSETPSMTGYLLMYGQEPSSTLPALERLFRNHLALRNFPPDRIVLKRGGYQEDVRDRDVVIRHPGLLRPCRGLRLTMQFIDS